MVLESDPPDAKGVPRAAVPTSRERLLQLVKLCHELANAESLEPMFAAVVDALAEGTGLQRTAVLTYDAVGTMRFRASRGLSEAYRARVDGHSPWPSDQVDPPEILVDDVTLHPVTRDLAPVLAAEGIAAVAFLPLVAGGRLLGKFMLYADRITPWQGVDLSFARAAADLLASFVLRENTQQRLLRARKMESLGLLAGGIAHDFNNLLTAMLGYADVMATDLPPGTPSHENAQELLQVVAEASELTRQLLDFARPKPFRVEVVDLVELVADARLLLARLAGQGVDITVLGTGKPLPVEVNRAQMQQVLRNLVTNARDAMPDGGRITISLGERCKPDGASVVELGVTDEGVGMDDATRARIFEPLFTTKQKGRGTGLGLSICYGIVAHLGGDITVTSRIGRGSTFVVSLPKASAAAEPAAPARPRSEPGPGASVLLVEDQAAVRQAVNIGLSSQGCRVTTATSGSEALDLLARGTFDVLVSDVVMPGMDGIELTERARRVAPDLPILLITGYAELAGELPPHVPVLQKPFTPTELAQRIVELVPQPRRDHQ